MVSFMDFSEIIYIYTLPFINEMSSHLMYIVQSGGSRGYGSMSSLWPCNGFSWEKACYIRWKKGYEISIYSFHFGLTLVYVGQA